MVLYFRHWCGAVRLDEVRRLRDPIALEVAVQASLLAALLSHEIHDALDRVAAETAPKPSPVPTAAFPPGAATTRPAPLTVVRPRSARAGRRTG